jgi:hypothetical protein
MFIEIDFGCKKFLRKKLRGWSANVGPQMSLNRLLLLLSIFGQASSVR